ncbi:hypothetical protein EVAR_53647_1 [Eumeta japonica]|uniref:Uncharacterized protein n=1 Tax=Eumeta variegata TaxID=151549 RepID=A0A4C1YN88_EUMVA|nr:hypothetical protein EVAR_53647_1 [Eumeta japonica]
MQFSTRHQIYLQIYKQGSDQAIFNFRNTDLANPLDEVQTYQSGRDEFAKTLLYVEVPRYYTWDASRKTWKRRIQGTSVQDWPGFKSGDALGRVYTVHACEARGLLENDNHWDVTLEEAAQCRSAGKMKELFAVLVATCGLSNPQQLWDKYKNDMTDDILHRLQEQNPNVTYSDLIYNEGLTKIEDQVKTISGKDLSDYGMIRPQRTEEISSDLIRELDYDTDSLQ